MAQLLLARGADPNATNHDGKTPLSEAFTHRHLDACLLLKEHGAADVGGLHKWLLRALWERLEQRVSGCSDLTSAYIRSIGGLLFCGSGDEETLAKVRDDIDRLQRDLGEEDERVSTLRRMYDIAVEGTSSPE